MKNKDLMNFQTALRKYVGNLKKVDIFFYPKILIQKSEKILNEKCGKFFIMS
jgi:hypothetical protein